MLEEQQVKFSVRYFPSQIVLTTSLECILEEITAAVKERDLGHSFPAGDEGPSDGRVTVLGNTALVYQRTLFSEGGPFRPFSCKHYTRMKAAASRHDST